MSRNQAAIAPVATPSSAPRPRRVRAPEDRGAASPAPTKARVDPEMAAAFLEILREQRIDAASALSGALEAKGADGMVCAFLGDDLREIAHSLADVENWVQGTLDTLERPSPVTLFEQATDVSVLNDLEHLFQTVDNLRRRLMQTSVGLRRSGG